MQQQGDQFILYQNKMIWPETLNLQYVPISLQTAHISINLSLSMSYFGSGLMFFLLVTQHTVGGKGRADQKARN